jgi:hypothetical protein
MHTPIEIDEYARLKLMNTPKAFANSSPGLERSDNPGIRTSIVIEP